MFRISLAIALFSPVLAIAQTNPQTVTLPTSDIAHAIGYLHNGGTRLEADALADQLTQAAQADLAKQQAAAKAAASPPASLEHAPTSAPPEQK